MDTQILIQGAFALGVILMVYSIPYLSDKMDEFWDKHKHTQ